jgi:ankyrin repeat protein
MGKNFKWALGIGVICIGALFVLTYSRGRILNGNANRQKPAAPVAKLSTPREWILRENEGWRPQDYFQEEDAIRACEAITARDQVKLQALIGAGLDVNVTGKAGFTLLYWAFAEDNFPAFELLLKFGADPGQKLTRSIYVSNKRPFFEGDSILFTCIRASWKPSQMEFVYAALAHSEKDPRDWEGKDVLTVFGSEHRFNGEILARLAESGVGRDIQNQYGDTAAMLAVKLGPPQIALRILQSGTDPSIRNKKGQSVKDLALLKMKLEKDNPNYPKEDAARLLEWLEQQGPPEADNLPEQP